MMHIDDIQNIKKLNKVTIEEEKQKQENIDKENANICFEIAVEEINKKLKEKYTGKPLSILIDLGFVKGYNSSQEVYDLLVEKIYKYYKIRGWNINIEMSFRSYLSLMSVQMDESSWYKIKRFLYNLFPNLFSNTNLLND